MMNYTTSTVRLASPTKGGGGGEGGGGVCRDEIEIRCFETNNQRRISFQTSKRRASIEHLLIRTVISPPSLKSTKKNLGLTCSSPAQKAIVVDLSRARFSRRARFGRAFSPFERDPKSPIAIQSIHDSRFKSPTFFHGSSNDTQFPLFFLSSTFNSESEFPCRTRMISTVEMEDFSPLFGFNVSHDRVYTGNL